MMFLNEFHHIGLGFRIVLVQRTLYHQNHIQCILPEEFIHDKLIYTVKRRLKKSTFLRKISVSSGRLQKPYLKFLASRPVRSLRHLTASVVRFPPRDFLIFRSKPDPVWTPVPTRNSICFLYGPGSNRMFYSKNARFAQPAHELSWTPRIHERRERIRFCQSVAGWMGNLAYNYWTRFACSFRHQLVTNLISEFLQ